MSVQYRCQNQKRREAVRQHPSLNGIDYLEVLDQVIPPGGTILRQRTLLVYFLKPVPASFNRDNVQVTGGVRVSDVQVEWAFPATALLLPPVTPAEQAFFNSYLGGSASRVLIVRTNSSGDFSTYRLFLRTSATDNAIPNNFDLQLSQVDFSFKVECPSEFDCKSTPVCPPEKLPEPAIDYLAKDYSSFRRLMLDRLSAIVPDWQERNPADLGIVLVEALAYAADHLSYYQDAVATEAYLGTARQRVSVRRHARLLDYLMHDGCNARVWVVLEVNATADGAILKGPTPPKSGILLTKVNQTRAILPPAQLSAALRKGAQVFETMHNLTLYEAHNQIHFYTWEDEECCLPKNATRATLQDDSSNRLRLRAGDVLLFEELRSPATGLEEDANPAHRHAVRLIKVKPEAKLIDDDLRQPSTLPLLDPLNNQAYVEIEWHPDDALPFPLCLSKVINGQVVEDITVVRGNVVLADYGQTIAGEALQPSVVPLGRYRPQLQRAWVTQKVHYDHKKALIEAARATVNQDPRAALAAVSLDAEGTPWNVQRDLLASDRFASEFVVETSEDGRASLRFGDGILGKRPVSGLIATYRIGNGTEGNVGAEAIAHIVTDEIFGITKVRNPLSAVGGINPESLEQVRLYAPQAFRTQQRAVTEEDYAAIAQRHPQVQKAAATLRWTGSWHTMFITVDRRGGLETNADDFKQEIRRFIEPFRLAGQDVEIDTPRFVPLDIAFTVCVAPGYFRSQVKQALLETFSTMEIPDGRRGFFHPDNWTFHQPLYLSQMVAAAMQVPGVRWVDTDNQPPKNNRFQRWGEPANGELEAGKIDCDRLEILRLDNDPNAPENGKLEFYMDGGL
ncbi:putative baseplate assembly protein [Nostoc minutum NIES-26]|uniref:Baseplate assembly protein n=1 Tax=Nostoc minutum NIES-26 TaxID=1844469 RepID=A0A367QYY9_9NOSO|nr:putative baseplate assembly protein [Nostoc minutum NIES-26]